MKFNLTNLIAIILLLPISAIAQVKKAKNSPKDFGFTTFKIKGSIDSISFIVSDTSFQKRKPLLLFSQGSLPTALFWKEDELHTWQQFIPFSYTQYLNEYDFVVISKPAIPVFTYTADKNYFYIDPLTKKIPKEYYEKNYLDYYVIQANDVINYLVKQKWVDKSKIVIEGHSQGSKVVSRLGAINKHVTQVVYLAGNPLGRYDQDIRQVRKDELLKKITPPQAQKEINDLYKRWNDINQKPDDTNSDGGDTNKAWTSFSTPLLSDLLKINVPIFIGYGTADNTSDYCDLLPLDYIRLGKHNYTMKPYPGFDHNFKKVEYDTEGNKISSEDHWDEVAADIFQWLEMQPVKK